MALRATDFVGNTVEKVGTFVAEDDTVGATEAGASQFMVPLIPPQPRSHYLIGAFVKKYPEMAPHLDAMMSNGYRIVTRNYGPFGDLDVENNEIVVRDDYVVHNNVTIIFGAEPVPISLKRQVEALKDAVLAHKNLSESQTTLEDLLSFIDKYDGKIFYGFPSFPGPSVQPPCYIPPNIVEDPVGTLERPTDAYFLMWREPLHLVFRVMTV